mgnify:FL=1
MTLNINRRKYGLPRQNRKAVLFDFTRCGGYDNRLLNLAHARHHSERGLLGADLMPTGLYVDWQAEPLTDEAMCGGLPDDELTG